MAKYYFLWSVPEEKGTVLPVTFQAYCSTAECPFDSELINDSVDNSHILILLGNLIDDSID